MLGLAFGAFLLFGVMLVLVGANQAELAHDGDRLRRECLVQLHQVEVVDADPSALERATRGRDRTEAHGRGVDARHGRRNHPRDGPEA